MTSFAFGITVSTARNWQGDVALNSTVPTAHIEFTVVIERVRVVTKAPSQ